MNPYEAMAVVTDDVAIPVLPANGKLSLQRVFISLSLMPLFLLLVVALSFAEDITDYKRMIKKGLNYPRDIQYTIPAELPTANVDAKKNDEYIKVSQTLEKMALVRIERKDSKSVLLPQENSADVVQAVQDMHYKTIAYNVTLGILNIEVNSFKKARPMVVVEGKTIFMPARTYDVLSKVLPAEILGDCAGQPYIWEIDSSRKDNEIMEKKGK